MAAARDHEFSIASRVRIFSWSSAAFSGPYTNRWRRRPTRGPHPLPPVRPRPPARRYTGPSSLSPRPSPSCAAAEMRGAGHSPPLSLAAGGFRPHLRAAGGFGSGALRGRRTRSRGATSGAAFMARGRAGGLRRRVAGSGAVRARPRSGAGLHLRETLNLYMAAVRRVRGQEAVRCYFCAIS